MKHVSFARVVYVLAFIATLIGFSAFSQKTGENNLSRKEQLSKDNDSPKAGKPYKNDKILKFDGLDLQIKGLDIEMDHLNQELKNLDFSKIQAQVDATMKKLEKENISAKIDEAIKKIDFDKLDKQINESMAQLNKEKMTEVKKELEKVKVELESQRKNLQITIPKIEMEKLKAETKEALENAKKSIENAKVEITNIKEFSRALESDGLINKSTPSKIEVKDGMLYIDGKKQSGEVNDKYKKYYRRENFSFRTGTSDTSNKSADE